MMEESSSNARGSLASVVSSLASTAAGTLTRLSHSENHRVPESDISRPYDSTTNLSECEGTRAPNLRRSEEGDEFCLNGSPYSERGRKEGGRDGDDVFRVVIVGAGPAGLVLANHLLTRGSGRFHVSVVENGEDPRKILEEAVEIARRYSIGLNIRAFRCLDTVPGLLTKVLACMVPVHQLCLAITSGKPTVIPFSHKDPPVLLADRTSLCRALLQALVGREQQERREEHEGKTKQEGRVEQEEREGHEGREGASRVSTGGGFDVYFNTQCEAIDMKNHTVTLQPVGLGSAARSSDCRRTSAAEAGLYNDRLSSRTAGNLHRLKQPLKLQYDLLVGADGVRSIVRNSLVTGTRDFAIEALPVFGEWAVASIPAPASLPPNSMILVPRVPRTPGIGVVGLPAEGGKLCLLWTWSTWAQPSDWLALRSNDEDEEEREMRRMVGRRVGDDISGVGERKPSTVSPKRDEMEGGREGGERKKEAAGLANRKERISSKGIGKEGGGKSLCSEEETEVNADGRSRARAYIAERLPWLGMTEEGAETLLHQQPRSSMRIKCWQYHDSAARIVLIGDSAHATCPSLGQGCNAAITDATVLGRLLLGEAVTTATIIPPQTEESTWKLLQGVREREGAGTVDVGRKAGCGAEGSSVWLLLKKSVGRLLQRVSQLTGIVERGRNGSGKAEREEAAEGSGIHPTTTPASVSAHQLRQQLPGLLACYSALQVPEGHALVDLSDAGAPISNFFSVISALDMVIRSLLSKFLPPWVVSPPLMTLAANTTLTFSTMLARFKGFVALINNSNTRMRRRWYESERAQLLSSTR